MAKNVQNGTTVRHAAELLRQEVFRRKDGDFLGSEQELWTRLNVSRPTFRQAAALVEQEQLLLVRRGVGGGYFARRPSTSAVAHVAAVYLHARSATIDHSLRAARPLFAETVREVARVMTPAIRGLFEEFLAREAELPEDDKKAFLRSEREFQNILSSSCPNPILELYAKVLVDFTASFIGKNVIVGDAERIAIYRKHRANLVRAIVAGDIVLAGLMSDRREDALIQWMEEDKAKSAKENAGAPQRRASAERIIDARSTAAESNELTPSPSRTRRSSKVASRATSR
jgi:Transcriptional regulators